MIIIICLILIILITKIEFRVINIMYETDVYIKIGFIKIHIDYDMFVKELNKVAKDFKLSFNDFKKGLGYYNIIKDIINNSKVNIKKVYVVKKTGSFNLINIYLNTSYYAISMFIKNFLTVNTMKQDVISFCILPSDTNDIDVDIDIELRLFFLLKSLLLNLKNIIKIKKDMV